VARTEVGDSLARTEDRPIGGQAVIEGVMIRSPERIATAVRRPDGRIAVQDEEYVSLTRRRKRPFALPVLRGIVSFAEMLVIGVRTLSLSACMAAAEPDAPESGKDRFLAGASMVLAFLVGLAILLFLPLATASALGLEARAFAYNTLAGAMRAATLLAYLWAIGRAADVARVFAYHGAEHQTVFAYEANEELTVETVRRYSRFHPRCGTSFILIVVLLAVLVYALLDAAFIAIVGRPKSLAERFGVHLAFLPLVAGVSFEALKASAAHRRSRFVRALVAPGLWLQGLTTRPPDEAQLAVAVEAARASLGLPPHDGASVDLIASPAGSRRD